MTEPDEWSNVVRAEGPSAWRKAGNQMTEAVANALSVFAGMPVQGKAGRYLRSIAADLLQEMGGDIELIMDALKDLGTDGKFRQAAKEGIYKVRPSIIQRCYVMREEDPNAEDNKWRRQAAWLAELAEEQDRVWALRKEASDG